MYMRLAFVLAFLTKYYCMYFKLIDWWDDCVCIIWGGRNTNRFMTQVYSAIYFVKEPISAVQTQSVVSLPHHTEFVQNVSKGLSITSTFYSLQYLRTNAMGKLGRGVRWV